MKNKQEQKDSLSSQTILWRRSKFPQLSAINTLALLIAASCTMKHLQPPRMGITWVARTVAEVN